MIARWRRRAARDEGYSLMEVMVTMGLMSVVMVVTLGAIMQMYAGTNRTETTSNARDQLTVAFRRLDKELRYASWISPPGQVGGRWYLEYAMPDGCRQLVYNNGMVTLASWTLPGTTPGKAAALASGLTLSGSTPPFLVYAAGAAPYASAAAGTAGVGRGYTTERTQVRLQFNAVSGTTSLPFDTIFSAQNTTRLTSAINDCSKGRPTT